MAEILKGAPVAAALDVKTAEAVKALRARGITPTLGILRVGERPDDLAYERAAVKRCDKLGIATKLVTLPADVMQGALLAKIAGLNSDPGVHGVLMFRPLPAQLDEREACEALIPAKDVDGITSGSAAALYTGSGDGFAPCTAEAVVALLEHYGIELSGKNAAVVGPGHRQTGLHAAHGPQRHGHHLPLPHEGTGGLHPPRRYSRRRAGQGGISGCG